MFSFRKSFLEPKAPVELFWWVWNIQIAQVWLERGFRASNVISVGQKNPFKGLVSASSFKEIMDFRIPEVVWGYLNPPKIGFERKEPGFSVYRFLYDDPAILSIQIDLSAENESVDH